MTTHWGELPPENNEHYIPDISGDIERSMSKVFLDGIDDKEELLQNIEQIKLPPMDPLMLHAVALHKYSKNLLESKDVSEENFEEIPKMPSINFKHKKNCLNYIPHEASDFVIGRDLDLPELGSDVVHEVLRKCVATMFAHIGYENSEESALEVATEVLDMFFRKISRQFKSAQEEEEKNRVSGFPNAIERILTEMGLGGAKGIHDYYQNRVLKYLTVLENRCRELKKNLKKSPQESSDVMNNEVVVKKEYVDPAESENAELHFSTIDGDVNYSIFETGYQLLNSLEAEGNLQSLREEDSQLPGIVSLSSEAELNQFKRKRLK